jgi:hypothetical protein
LCAPLAYVSMSAILHIPKMSIDIPQTKEPNLSQKRFPLIWTNKNMKAIAEINLTTPKIPVRNKDEETEVNPADIKITGASVR